METIYVVLDPQDAANILCDGIPASGTTISCVGRSESMFGDKASILLVFEKYFMRNSSRASLSVMVENLSGRTAVHFAGAGGGQGMIFNFDWGAGESFSSLVPDVLSDYML